MEDTADAKTPLDEQEPTFGTADSGMDRGKEDVTSPEKAAPDGGWGWVVVGASFLISWNIGAMLIAFSLLYPEFTRYFNAEKGVTGWIGSLYLAVGTYFGTHSFFSFYSCLHAFIFFKQ